ncbi:MAG: glutamate racemase [Alkalispirochaetaceae bacterium]
MSDAPAYLLSDTSRTRLLVIDSGVGGLAYTDYLMRIRDAFTICYVADTAGFPYGEKRADWLEEHLVELVGEALVVFPPDLVLIACNTASVTALDRLRQAYSIPFIGTVPAVKPAARWTKTGVIGLLATSATVRDDYLDRLVQEFAASFRVIRSGASELVRQIEGGFPELSEGAEVSGLIRKELEQFKDEGADVVVLGCTHFLHILPAMRRVLEELGGGVTLVDSRDGVARRVLDLARRHQLPTVTGFGKALVKPGRTRGARRTAPGGVRGLRGALMTTRFRNAPPASRPEEYRQIAASFRLGYRGVLSLPGRAPEGASGDAVRSGADPREERPLEGAGD